MSGKFGDNVKTDFRFEVEKCLKTLEDLIWNLKSAEGNRKIVKDLEVIAVFVRRKIE